MVTVPPRWLPSMTSVSPDEHPPEAHVRWTPLLPGGGETVESHPVPAPFVSWVTEYEFPSGPVSVRVSPPAPVVRVSAQPPAWFSMNGWVESQLAPYWSVNGPLHFAEDVRSLSHVTEQLTGV